MHHDISLNFRRGLSIWKVSKEEGDFFTVRLSFSPKLLIILNGFRYLKYNDWLF